MPKNLVVILGPTAVGKTDVGIELAKFLKSEIISCDSRQFYKELSIGTAKPDEKQLKIIKHHFINHISIQEYYNASKFEIEAVSKINELFNHNDYVVMVGGSGLYIDAVCDGIDDIPEIDMNLRAELIYRLSNEGIESLRIELKKLDPEYYNNVDLKNKNRILRAIEVSIVTGKPYSSFRKNKTKKRKFNILKIGLIQEREILYQCINKRVDIMLEQGLVDEAKNLLKYKELNALKTVGYRELFQYFEKEISFEKAVELIKRNTRHYAKKQITWFNRYNDINWLSPKNISDIKKLILSQSI